MKPLFSLAPFLVFVPLACGEEARVGVVDVQEAFQHSPLVMVSALELKGDLGDAQRDLKRRGRQLAELRQRFEHGGVELDAEQRGQIEARIAKESAHLADLQRKYRAELAAAQTRRGEEMITRVEEVARAVAREKGLTLLVRKDGILYAEDGLDCEPIDITAQVSRALLEKINPTEIPEVPAYPEPSDSAR